MYLGYQGCRPLIGSLFYAGARRAALILSINSEEYPS
jgi:hypothetical protein